jgi:hypothetical protein
LVRSSQPGDLLVFHYSGHGSQKPDQNGDEADGLDETICPLDYETKGMITDDRLAEIVKSLPADRTLFAVLDCCHSGSGLDLFKSKKFETTQALAPTPAPAAAAPPPVRYYYPANSGYPQQAPQFPFGYPQPQPGYYPYVQQAYGHGQYFPPAPPAPPAPQSYAQTYYVPQGLLWYHRVQQQKSVPVQNSRSVAKATFKHGPIFMLSGCRDNQTSAGANIEGEWQGAMTFSLKQVVGEMGGLSEVVNCFRAGGEKVIVGKMHEWLAANGYSQRPVASREDGPAPVPARLAM